MFFKTAIRWTQNIVKTYDKEKNQIEKHCWEKYHNFNWDKKSVDMEKLLTWKVGWSLGISDKL